MTDFAEDFAAYVAEHGTPDRFELLLCDLNAVLRGKWVPGTDADKLAGGGVRLPLSTYAPNILGHEVPASGLGIVVGDPDGVLKPVPGSLCPVPWADGNVAQVQVEMWDGDAISPTSPRALLEGVLNRFDAQGLRPVVATELEFYILQRRATPDAAPVPPVGSPDAQNYDMEVLDRTAPILNEIEAAARAQGLATDTLIAEYGPGQFEVNFHHTDDALAASDTALMFRRLVRGVVGRHGMEATFMAKPYAAYPGNGLHVHASVLGKDGKNIFDESTELSPKLAAAVAGCLDTAADLQAIFAPHLNSYRRFLPNSFAPSSPDWGHDHRGAGVRIPQATGPAARLEHRIAGADANPYLALAAVLGGMLWGMETEPFLPLPLDHPDAEAAAPLGHDWTAAVERFAASDIAAEIFGTRYRAIYAAVRRDEIAALTAELTPMEYRTYLSRL